MQLLSCHIAVAGDDANVIVRDHDTAVTYPELLIIKALHGSENVRHVKDAGDVERDSEEERDRLRELYGELIVKQVFPGAEHQGLPEQDNRMRKAKSVFTDDDDEKAEKPVAKPVAGKKG